jgi:CDGSH-type Zn-finger protein
MSNCTCGRTTRPPMCDGSHCLSEQQYQERTERLEKLFGKEKQDDRHTNKNSPTE